MHYAAVRQHSQTIAGVLLVMALVGTQTTAHGSRRRTLAFEPLESELALPEQIAARATEAFAEELEEHEQLVLARRPQRAQYRVRTRVTRLEESASAHERRTECEVSLVVESRRSGILAVLGGRAAARG